MCANFSTISRSTYFLGRPSLGLPVVTLSTPDQDLVRLSRSCPPRFLETAHPQPRLHFALGPIGVCRGCWSRKHHRHIGPDHFGPDIIYPAKPPSSRSLLPAA